MADEVDIANDRVEIMTAAAVKAAGNTRIPVNTTGRCWGCGEHIDGERRWHNAECREFWEVDNGKK